jgi:hypothetical protein
MEILCRSVPCCALLTSRLECEPQHPFVEAAPDSVRKRFAAKSRQNWADEGLFRNSGPQAVLRR